MEQANVLECNEVPRRDKHRCESEVSEGSVDVLGVWEDDAHEPEVSGLQGRSRDLRDIPTQVVYAVVVGDLTAGT
jgi:hypothetical protein